MQSQSKLFYLFFFSGELCSVVSSSLFIWNRHHKKNKNKKNPIRLNILSLILLCSQFRTPPVFWGEICDHISSPTGGESRDVIDIKGPDLDCQFRRKRSLGSHNLKEDLIFILERQLSNPSSFKIPLEKLSLNITNRINGIHFVSIMGTMLCSLLWGKSLISIGRTVFKF